MSFRNLLAVTALVALAACGGGNNQSSSGSTTESSNGRMTGGSTHRSSHSAANEPMSGMNASGDAMAPGTPATVPPGVSCGAVHPVWVNTKTHVYHEPSDPFYGRTKHGEYMCPSQAAREGYHRAGGAKHRSASSSDSTEQ